MIPTSQNFNIRFKNKGLVPMHKKKRNLVIKSSFMPGAV
jgi:hypothetical protein